MICQEKHPLSFSMALERREWTTPKIIDLIRQIRGTLSRASNLHIDLNSSKRGIPTDVRSCGYSRWNYVLNDCQGNFWNEYVCLPASTITSAYSDADLGGKILLPGPALQELMGRSMYGSGGGFNYGYNLQESGGLHGDSPMVTLHCIFVMLKVALIA